MRTSLAAKKMLLNSDAEWERLRGKMRAEDDDALFVALHDAYREGIATSYGAREVAAAEQVFAVIARESGESKSLTPGTFWTASVSSGL